MSGASELDVSLEDLGLAYRKAKADLFYSPRACREALDDFEVRLAANLKKLRDTLIAGNAPDIPADAWTLVPKGVKDPEPESDVISSDPTHLWSMYQEKAGKNGPEIEMRVMEQLPVEFHVFAALWIHKVGHEFEAKLSDAARGNRLRRTADKEKLNLLSMGSTVPYLYPYLKWRDDAIAAMELALEHGKPVVAITADVRSFYHKLDPQFMLKTDFMEKIGVQLSAKQRKLHELFICALRSWAETTPLGNGLPVGLTASSVIANVALFELDLLIEREITPLYYGRYVDDIIVVMENASQFQNSGDIWNWFNKRLDGAVAWLNREEMTLKYERPYLEGSEIVFANEKNKTFLLSGSSGRAVLGSLRRAIQERTSEWRSLPNLPQDATLLESTVLSAIQTDGVSSDSLRKADKVSVRRAGFALKLRNIEAYQRLLPPHAWRDLRHAFFDTFTTNILVLPTFFDFFNYLPRVLALAITCRDFDYLNQMLKKLEKIYNDLQNSRVYIKSLDDQAGHTMDSESWLDRFWSNVTTHVCEVVAASFPFHLKRSEYRQWMSECASLATSFSVLPIKELRKAHRRYLKRDLAHEPLKQLILGSCVLGLASDSVPLEDLCNRRTQTRLKLLPPAITDGVKKLRDLIGASRNGRVPSGLLFPTRPLAVRDLYLLHANPFSEEGSEDISQCLLAQRGFKPKGRLPVKGKGGSPARSVVRIASGNSRRKRVRIAVASWKTEIGSRIASTTRTEDPDDERLARLLRLLNGVVGSRQRPDYLIFPELSMPPRWFLAVGKKLHSRGISLISGIEYQHNRNGKTLHNQVWASLSHDELGFPTTVIHRQDKQCAALHEEDELRGIDGKVLVPVVPWESPPVINHGGFYFALLICSELTNIAYRTALRGKVDALFVPEWNRDTESFNALVESSALDIHAYIAQCNDRTYGDSRIRSPAKNSWERDIIRVKGGLEDYFVVGEIDIHALRAFQSHHRSPEKPFKPVPDGFRECMLSERRVLPSKGPHEE